MAGYAQAPLNTPYTDIATAEQIAKVPKNFLHHHQTFINVVDSTWSDVEIPSGIAALFEQETCITLTHSKCWSRFAELKTDREYGFGLGQITVTSRFNVFNEVRALDSRLKQWKWDDRYNAEFQMIAGVAMLKRNYRIFKDAETPRERFAFATASYNGGIGGVQSDQRICRNTSGCNPNRWFGNVERTSLKAKTSVNGYSKSFYQINREHSHNIMNVRREKYKPLVDPYFNNVKY